jgi:oxaloacetate decarboxylase alpha subunit/pyruvate carboxylase subunit B
MDDLRKELKDLNMPSDDEHCIIHAMFPQQLATHFKNKNKSAKVSVPTAKAATTTPAGNGEVKRYVLNVNGKRIEVGVEELL